MSASQVKDFWARIANDPAYRETFRGALPERPTPQDLAGFACATGFDVREEDFILRARAATATNGSAGDAELDDDLLEAVSGGSGQDSYATDPIEMNIYTTWEEMKPVPPPDDGVAVPTDDRRPPAPDDGLPG